MKKLKAASDMELIRMIEEYKAELNKLNKPLLDLIQRARVVRVNGGVGFHPEDQRCIDDLAKHIDATLAKMFPQLDRVRDIHIAYQKQRTVR